MSIRPLRLVVTGHFQVGKSTLINCLLRAKKAATGDRTSPTTPKAEQFPSPCGRLLLVDTPGVNAMDEHDAHTEKAIESADAALLVVANNSQLSRPLQTLAAKLSKRRIPTAVAVNCWHSNDSNDPKDPHPAVDAIKSQLSQCGLRIAHFEQLNIEWAAAARGVLPPESIGRLRRRNPEFFEGSTAEPTPAALQRLEEASRIHLIQGFLLPSPFESLAPGGLEYRVLLSRLLRLIQNSP